jgi:hypothetical protein
VHRSASASISAEPGRQVGTVNTTVRSAYVRAPCSTPMRVDGSQGASVQLSSDARSVLLYPRRKQADRGNAAVQQPQRGRKPIAIERSTFEAVFHMPQPDAAKQLGISLTSMKQVSRKLGLTKWPYRPSASWRQRASAKGRAQRTLTLRAWACSGLHNFK